MSSTLIAKRSLEVLVALKISFLINLSPVFLIGCVIHDEGKVEGINWLETLQGKVQYILTMDTKNSSLAQRKRSDNACFTIWKVLLSGAEFPIPSTNFCNGFIMSIVLCKTAPFSTHIIEQNCFANTIQLRQLGVTGELILDNKNPG